MFGLKSKKKHEAKTDDPFLAQRLLFENKDKLVIFDIGAYIGKVSQTYMEIFSGADIYSFEPFLDSFTQLSELASGANGKIKTVNVAVSENIGKVRFNVNNDLTCNSVFARPKNAGKYYSPKAEHMKQIEVDTNTIDNFCKINGVNHIDILKIDVEGAELNVFKGARQMFLKNDISIVYTEVMFVKHYEGGCMYYDIALHLEQYGFTLFNIYNTKQAKNGQLRYGNAIFLSPQMRKKVDAMM